MKALCDGTKKGILTSRKFWVSARKFNHQDWFTRGVFFVHYHLKYRRQDSGGADQRSILIKGGKREMRPIFDHLIRVMVSGLTCGRNYKPWL